MEDIKIKVDEYKRKKDQLSLQRQETERQLIILGEQYKSYEEKIVQAFGTSDPDKLIEIAQGYEQDISILEKELENYDKS